jgi:hypothetical protein
MSEPSAGRGDPRKELAVPQPAAEAGPSAPRDLSWLRDRLRIGWTPRSAAGAGLFATSVFLLPFAGWPWLPVAIGLGLLVVLRLLRLDGLMRGWAPHVAGVVVVALLLARTSPWVWALGLSLGIVVAGLLRLPRWHVLAVGAALLLVSGIGYGFALKQANAEQLQQQAQAQIQDRGRLGAARPTGVLPVLLASIARRDAPTVCETLLDGPAVQQFTTAQGATDCAAAVERLAARVTDTRAYSSANAPLTRTGDESLVDACHLTWSSGGSAGPQVGQLTIGRTTGQTYFVTHVAPCP